MRSALSGLILIALFSVPVLAETPDPPCVSCTLDAPNRALLIPASDPPSQLGAFTVTVRNSDCVPIPYAFVECTFGGLNTSRVHLCPSAVLSGYANDIGVISFNIPGGGCFKGANGLSIRANGVEVRNYSAVVGPDYAASDNTGQPGMWDLRVSLTDFVAFTAAFGTGAASCHDYDNNGVTNVADFALFGRFWSDASGGCH